MQAYFYSHFTIIIIKFVKVNKFFKTKNKTRKDKNDANEPVDNNDNINLDLNLNHNPDIAFRPSNSGPELNENNPRYSIPLLNRDKLLQLQNPNKLKKDTKGKE